MSAKRSITAILLVLAMALSGLCQNGGSSLANDYENPEVVGRNKEPGHCTLMVYPDGIPEYRGRTLFCVSFLRRIP